MEGRLELNNDSIGINTHLLENETYFNSHISQSHTLIETGHHESNHTGHVKYIRWCGLHERSNGT